jgi:hypothetical protein
MLARSTRVLALACLASCAPAASGERGALEAMLREEGLYERLVDRSPVLGNGAPFPRDKPSQRIPALPRITDRPLCEIS